MQREFIYLAIVMDVFTRRIRGWQLSRSIDQGLTLAALERALATPTPTIHHSDQGVQYAATAYVERLRGLGVAPSMAAIGEPRENGYAERLMRTIKYEEVDIWRHDTVSALRAGLSRYFSYYNDERPHQSLNNRTPAEVYREKRKSRKG